MIEWVLVFWLENPANSAEHQVYATERLCRDSEQRWQRRLNMVKSKLVAECRERER